MTVEERLGAWEKLSGSWVSEAERDFAEHLRQARDLGVGYGWMIQVIDWEWQDKSPDTFSGPSFVFQCLQEAKEEIEKLRAENARLAGIGGVEFVMPYFADEEDNSP